MEQTKKDIIGDVYNGCCGESRQQDAKMRIDWICGQATGQRILDIGCSQGIVPLLLGRTQKDVLGIDIDSGSIDHARQKLLEEPVGVQQRVRYECMDFMQQMPEGTFDCILMTEVLEHVQDPVTMLQRARQKLSVAGRIIITVPFGINPHPDHLRTYYFSNLRDQVEDCFRIEDIHFWGRWIGIIAVPTAETENFILRYEPQFVHDLEDAFSAVDRFKQDRIDRFSARIEKLGTDLSLQKERNDSLQVTLESNRSLINEQRKNLSLAQKKQAELTESLKSLSEELAAAHVQNEVLSSENSRVKTQYEALANSILGRLTLMLWQAVTKVRNLRRKLKKFISRKHILQLSHKFKKSLSLFKRRIVGMRKAIIPSKQLPQVAIPTKNGYSINAAKLQNPWCRVPQEEFVKKTDLHFLENVLPMLNQLPMSNGGRYYIGHPQKIGIVADEFLFDSIRAAANFVFLPPENWEPLIPELDLLLIVSAWKGIGEEWRGAAKEGTEKREALYRIIEQCQKREISTVFYSKEDPPNYVHFLELAKRCDYIFTTCLEVVENYKKDCQNERVNVLRFGINPLFHNPIGLHNAFKKPGVIFSGSWMNKYPERQVDMRMLLSGVQKSGQPLKIVDRNYDRSPVSYRYPPEYWEYLSPAIPHDLLQKVHKLYDWALNINTVKISRTMFANRGYELQGAGNLLLSNYSFGVSEQLPNIFIAHNSEEAARMLTALSPEEVYERQITGVRAMMTGNTCFDRIGQVLETVGMMPAKSVRQILIVVDQLTEHLRQMFEVQTYSEKKLVRIKDLTEELFAAADMIAFFSDEMEYDLFYLEDMANGFKYTDSDYITKAAYYEGFLFREGPEHDYVAVMESKFRTLFWRESFSLTQLLALHSAESLPNGYSIDHFNYNACRWAENSIDIDYTWKLSIVIPVKASTPLILYTKAFSSLRRSSLFPDLEILFLTDKTTSQQSSAMVASLARKYEKNVRVISFLASSSSDLSFEIHSPYFMLLEPQQECLNDGLSLLLQKAEEQRAEIALGNALICTKECQKRDMVKAAAQAGLLQPNHSSSCVDELADEYFDSNVCVVKKELLEQSTALSIRQWFAAAQKIVAVDLEVCAEYPFLVG